MLCLAAICHSTHCPVAVVYRTVHWRNQSAKGDLFVAVQQLGSLRHGDDIPCRSHNRTCQTGNCGDPHMRFHAEVPLRPFLQLMYLGIARLGTALWLGCCCGVRVVDDGFFSQHAASELESCIDCAKEALCDSLSLQQASELEQRRCIRLRRHCQVHADDVSHRTVVVNGVLDLVSLRLAVDSIG